VPPLLPPPLLLLLPKLSALRALAPAAGLLKLPLLAVGGW
jgi:hypothetical protein